MSRTAVRLLSLVLVAFVPALTFCSKNPPAEATDSKSAAPPVAPAAPARLETRMVRVESVDFLPKMGAEEAVRPQSGHRLWLVHFKPIMTDQLEKNPEDAVLVDEVGSKHRPMKMRGQLRSRETSPGWVTFELELEALVFSVPRNRHPQSLQVGARAPVSLPQP